MDGPLGVTSMSTYGNYMPTEQIKIVPTVVLHTTHSNFDMLQSGLKFANSRPEKKSILTIILHTHHASIITIKNRGVYSGKSDCLILPIYFTKKKTEETVICLD